MENTSTDNKIVNSHADVPDINKYLTPLNQNNFGDLQSRIEAVMQTFQNKIDENSSLIIVNENEITIKENQFSKIKRVNNYENQYIGKDIKTTYNFILDCVSFVHRDSEIKNINKDLFKNLLSLINNKGIIMYLMDYHHLIQIPQIISEIINENEKLNVLVKIHIIEKVPLVGLLTLQKFEGSPCKFENLKLLSYEIYEDNTITKPISYLVNDLGKSLSYMNEMYQYQGYLSELRPGTILKVNVKENFWSENIDFTLTIVDTEEEELLAKKTCASIIVTKAYSNDFIYLAKEGNMQLCRQVNASRLILIRPNAFNFDSTQVIKDKISHYILLFKFRDCVDQSIPIMVFSDSKNEQFEVFRSDKFVIRDMVENEKKETFRQLVFFDAPNEVQSEVKLILTTKAKAKSDPDYYTTLPTINKYKEKHLVSCLDKNFICSFYIKCLLCGIFFIPTDNFSENNINLMILGAGIGSVNHFFNKIFKEKISITSVEIDKSMPEIGQKYFGFNNSLSSYKWVYGDANEYLLKSKEQNKYDIIISDINNTNPNDGLSPPPVFFSNETLSAIKDSLKDTGLYIINLMSRSYKNYNYALTVLESNFENIFVVENNEDLNKIHFCFKKKLSNDEYVKIFKSNLENFKENADISIIENDYKRILGKIVDRSDIVKK